MIRIKHMSISVMITLVVITLFACEGNYKNVKKLSLKDGLPAAEGKDVNVFYTDSGKVVTNLLAPKLLDYSTLEFPYQEFPDGVEVRFYDKGKKNTVTADYGVRYEETGIIDLRGNVVLVTADGNVLNAEQLYWNQVSKWVFTDMPYRMTTTDGSYNAGASFDSNEDFTVFLSRKNDGIQIVDQSKIEETDGE